MKIEIHIATERSQEEPWTRRQQVDIKVQAEDTARGAQPTQTFLKELTTGVQKIAGDVASRL